MHQSSTISKRTMTSSKQLDYTFTTIADTTKFATFEFSPTGVPIPTAPAINDKDEVAFWGANSPTDAGIFVSDGSSLRTIADLSGRPFQKFTSVTAPGFEGDLTRIVAERNHAGLRQFLSAMNYQD